MAAPLLPSFFNGPFSASLFVVHLSSLNQFKLILRPVQMERIIRSRIGQFNACVKCAQIENSISYCVNACNLRRSEQAIKLKSSAGFKLEV